MKTTPEIVFLLDFNINHGRFILLHGTLMNIYVYLLQGMCRLMKEQCSISHEVTMNLLSNGILLHAPINTILYHAEMSLTT